MSEGIDWTSFIYGAVCGWMVSEFMSWLGGVTERLAKWAAERYVEAAKEPTDGR